ncbi:hypothetical protein BGAL_0014g00190 [Botrytis galanthina]|uniref:F-box domain-containing protein n=1 Tax=Botrytis galanthina TaxID=278940 RepID=A0A4S8RJZ5_9HELO|nr:hypothetical protein BGAL_0014g00190 [Botrytis galanthina]
MMNRITQTAQTDAVVITEKKATTQTDAFVMAEKKTTAQTDAVIITEKKTTAQTDEVAIAENKTLARNNVLTHEQRKSTSPALLGIPAEIIKMIAEFLPEKNAACLTLCSRSMKEVLGDRYLKAMHIPYKPLSFLPRAEITFLELLARDLPQHFACFECDRIHQARTIKWPNNTKDHLGCETCTRRRHNVYSLKLESPFRIHFAQIYLAAKQHRTGIDLGFPLQAFRHQEVTHSRFTNVTSVLSVDARFVSNELVLRSQTWDFVPRSPMDRDAEILAYGGVTRKVCKHSERDSDCFFTRAQCHYCPMHFVTKQKHHGDAGNVFIITRWINLGAGLDPKDRKWQSHIRREGLFRTQPGVGIKKAFEDQEGLSLEEFTSGNEKLLREWRNQASN